MPAVRKVSKEQIIDAAVEVLRDDGFSAINARSVAKKLGCSTQPIYFSFKNMDELKAALTQRAIELHTQRVRDSLRAHEGSDYRFLKGSRSGYYFNPRSHEGSDDRVQCILCAITQFQSTLPRGERQCRLKYEIEQAEISIHAPTRGAT